MLNAGIVGFGGLGHVHANSLWQLEGVTVKAVCDINPQQLEKQEVTFNIEQAPNQFDISTCNTYLDCKQMLESEELDLVVVALPTYLHAEYSIMAMEHGASVFSEKPMALTTEQCDRMIEARDANQVQLMIGQCIRFWPEYEYLREILDDQTYGKLHSLYMQRGGSYPFTDSSSWYADHNKSGGALLDLHVHDLDFMHYALGSPTKTCALGVVGTTGGVDDHTGIFQFDSGAICTIRCSWMIAAGFAMSYIAILENATLYYDASQQPTLKLFRTGATEPETIEVETESAYVREMRYFLECVAGEHKNVRCPAESTRNSICLANEEQRLILGKLSF